MSSDPASAARGSPPIGFVVALAAERACLERQCARGAPWLVVQSGPGPGRAAAAAERLVREGVVAVVSFGFAGGLDARAPPGTVVVPQRIVQEDGAVLEVDASWRERLACFDDGVVAEGDIVSVAKALESPVEKSRVAAATGAIAVDMESGAIAAVARRSGTAFVALRVVIDGATDALPHGVEEWIDAAGNRRILPVLRAAVNPTAWRGLAVLVRRYALAARVLARLAAALAAADLAAPRAAAVPRPRR